MTEENWIKELFVILFHPATLRIQSEYNFTYSSWRDCKSKICTGGKGEEKIRKGGGVNPSFLTNFPHAKPFSYVPDILEKSFHRAFTNPWHFNNRQAQPLPTTPCPHP
jgi:hypothetical protein